MWTKSWRQLRATWPWATDDIDWDKTGPPVGDGDDVVDAVVVVT